MAPVTRSMPKASSSKRTLDNDGDEHPQDIDNDSTRQQDEQGSGSTLQTLLKRALSGAKDLERENDGLRKKVKALEGKLERVQDAEELSIKPKRGKRAAGSVPELQKKVQLLKNEVQKLEKANEKYRRRIHELSMREVKKDADDLVEDAQFEVGDSAYKMRKLLREFQDLMEASALGEEEDCAICFEQLKLKECSSMPCEHMFCNKCLQMIPPDAESYHDEVESIRCPSCRALCPRDELETVKLTSMQRWDALLEVAKKWAQIDMRRQEDTSEEEVEEAFIDDGTTNDASTTVSEQEPHNPLETSPEPEDQEAKPPPSPRLRRRTAVSPPSRSPGPENVDAEAPGPSIQGKQLGRTAGTPPPPEVQEAGPSTPTRPAYSQTPRRDKRKMLQQMAEARSKKPRL